jgi:hypothetical protein
MVAIETKKEMVTFAKKIKPAFEKEGLDEKADLKFTFDPFTFNGILKETHIPLITKNGAISAIQIVDFSLGEQTVVHHLYETKILQQVLNVFAIKAKTAVNKIKIAFEEPNEGTLQHELFDLSFQNYKDDFDFITPDKLEKETDIISNSNNIKFSEFLMTLEF